jgi:hypothetical protein
LIAQTPNLIRLWQLVDPPEGELSAQLDWIDATYACHLRQIGAGLAHSLRQTGQHVVFTLQETVTALKAGHFLS